MPFKLNAKGRDDDSGYDLVYGKGKNKLSVFAAKQTNGKFLCPELDVASPVMLREIKQVALAWFEANYQGGSAEEPDKRFDGTVTEPGNTAVVRVATGLRDPVCEGERLFFAELAVLTRRLTDAEASQLRDITNYLTGFYEPVKIEENQDAEHTGHTEDTTGVDAGAADVQPAPAASGPPPYRPRVPAAGPPPYRKPVGG